MSYVITRAIFHDLKLDNMILFFRKYYFIWPNKNDWVRTHNYCTK